MPREFSVTPPSSHAAWLLGALLTIPVVIIAATARLIPAADSTIAKPGLAFGLVTVVAVAAWTFWGLRRRNVRLEGRQLTVKAAMFNRALDVGELDLARARILDLEERTELTPMLKTFGMALPGFQAGWFLLRDRNQSFCLITSRRRVLWLPTRAGKSLLLSLDRPDALLAALHDASHAALPGKP
jgi:hypothetical protein